MDILDDIFRDLGIQRPILDPLNPEQIPPLPNHLLVHHGGLTRKLERTHGGSVQLVVLKSVVQGEICHRQVLLLLNEGKDVAAMAFIRIHLGPFAAALREKILSEVLPLGKLLYLHQVQHRHVPQMFFSLEPHPLTSSYLVPDESAKLYGRRVLIMTDADEVLADSVEVLSSQNEVFHGAYGQSTL